MQKNTSKKQQHYGLRKTRSEENYYLAQVDLTGKFHTGSIGHTLLVGADADKYKTQGTTFETNKYNNDLSNTSIKGKNIYDTINIFDPYGSRYSKRNDIPYLATNLRTTTPINRAGVYVQDLVNITSQLKFLAGVRFSYQENGRASVDTLAKGKRGFINSYTTSAFSPRLGL